MLRKLLPFLLIAVFSIAAIGQDRPGELRGTVKEFKSGMTVPSANVIVKKDDQIVTGTTTDMDGQFIIKPLQPGRYTVEASFIGFATSAQTGVIVSANKVTKIDFELKEESELLGEVDVIEYVVPLIDPDKQGKTTTGEELTNLPQRDVASIASTAAGVYQQDDGSGINVRGSRGDATDIYIDGIKVRGSSQLPQTAIDQLTIITGGVPAQYGDATGGIISITTRGPSNRYFGGIELNSSEMFDDYGQNLLGLNLSGPLVRDDSGRAVLGFFLAGEAQFQRDPNPSAVGAWKVRDDVIDELNRDPLRPAAIGNGTLRNSEFLTYDDLEKSQSRLNVARQDYRISGKFDWLINDQTNLTFGGQLTYSRFNVYSYTRSLLNFNNNSEAIQNSWRVFARFQQSFADDESSSSNIKNAFYSLQVDYSRFNQTQQDEDHEDRLFNYGYVGKFDTKTANLYSYGTDTVSGYTGYLQTGFRDTIVEFTPGDLNPNTTAYTEDFYGIAGGNPDGRYENIFQIQQGGGLLNGGSPANIYSLWFNSGTQFNGYNLTDNSQFRVVGSGSADIKGHSIILGFEYEQRVDRRFGVAPVGLWGLAYQLANRHNTQLDFSNPQPVFVDGVFQDTVNYNRLYDEESQTWFSRNLYKKLGMDEQSVDFLDVHAYDPGTYDIEMFSADELLNNGNSFVSYYGYDHHGNKLEGNPTLDDFFTARDENGNFKREIPAFQPIYIAGYIQDKFYFNDLVFNVGVRVDRFDANQPVLRDMFSLFPTVSALEAKTQDSDFFLSSEIPSVIGDDYVVYVNDLQNPTQIVGYRDGMIWYDSQGNLLTDPAILAQSTSDGRIAPYLRDPNNVSTSTDLSSESFVDYEPQLNVMPRISFNFPISDEALFFAHYDILTSRPSTAVRLDPTDYLFIEATQGRVLNNPNLQPEKTIDYEVGFKQTLSTSSALTISAYYRELRDMIQVQNVLYAFPVTYLNFGNLDFGTVKGFSLSYDLRRTKNVSLNVNYTLQFADGSGSSATSGLNLISSGQPNLRTILPLSFDQRHTLVAVLDYRYGSGAAYNGPTWWGKKVFENAGANFTFRAGSGTPYTRQSNVLQAAAIGINQRPILRGQINGSRLPWQFRIDMRLNKTFDLAWGAKEEGQKQKRASLNVYLDVQNLLNTRNVIGVYRYTGNPDDDGWLSSAEAQEIIANQVNSQSYRDLYSVKVNNPANYTLPRRMRLGVQINF
jgi:outer membrane receptor protein involved in Fe transport